jgi:hypothetical protein
MGARHCRSRVIAQYLASQERYVDEVLIIGRRAWFGSRKNVEKQLHPEDHLVVGDHLDGAEIVPSKVQAPDLLQVPARLATDVPGEKDTSRVEDLEMLIAGSSVRGDSLVVLLLKVILVAQQLGEAAGELGGEGPDSLADS